MSVAAPVAVTPLERRRVPLRQRDAWRFATNVPFVLGTLGILAIALIALFGPQLAPADPQAQRVIFFYPDGTLAAPPTPPDQYNLLGTDPLGRDTLSRLLWGARLTLTIVLLGLLGRGALAVLLGVTAGWRRGSWIDQAIGHVTNAVGGLPQLMLALLLVIVLQGQGIVGFVVALALVGWAELAQFVRAEVIRVVATPHVEAARALGGSGAHVVRVHVLRDLAPQLLGLLALEAGSVLLLLAELGFIGFFIAGGVFYVDDNGRPILPVRDRAPEWGQMLAGARQYTFRDQYVALIPGLVVASAVLAFNLFAEGLRTASDPFAPGRLSPRTLGRIARVTLVTGIVASAAFAVVSVRSTTISYAEGLRSAREAAQRVLPGGEPVAGIVAFSAEAHALERPERLTYYFRDPDERILRVTFIDADANAMDVKLHTNEDGLLIDALAPLRDDEVVDWQVALRAAEELEGLAFRNETRNYTVRVILARDLDADRPLWRVQYGQTVGGLDPLEVRIDATTGSTSLPPERLPLDAASRASTELGGPAKIIRTSATWLSAARDGTRAYGAEAPAQYQYQLVRADIPDPRTVTVSFDGGHTGLARVSSGGRFGGSIDTSAMPASPLSVADLEAAFAKAEDAGMRERRERWIAEGGQSWSATASSSFLEDRWVIHVSFGGQPGPSGGGALYMTFRYDPATGQVEEIPPGFFR